VLNTLEIVEAAVLPAIFFYSGGDGGELLLHPYTFHLPLFFVDLPDYYVGVILVDLLDSF